jgi:DeoR family glycerol-3-phosphate regulon repressor
MLVRMIGERGQISVSRMATELNVSEMTIRRDLDLLADAGLINRDHGGATMVSANGHEREEPTFAFRDGTQADAKAQIAQAAVRLVKPRQTIGLDTGSTVHRFAKELMPIANLRVFTSNLRTGSLLASGVCPVYALGGRVRADELSVYGSTTSAQLRELWFDTVFIGVSGLTVDGLSDYSPEDSDIKRAFIERTNQVVVLCDSSKFNRRSLMLVSQLSDIHVLVTETAPPGDLADALTSAKVRVIVADQSDNCPTKGPSREALRS